MLKPLSNPNGWIKFYWKGSQYIRHQRRCDHSSLYYVDNAAAKVLVDIAKIQDDEVGDGTTSVAVLCGKLLVEAEKLINQRIHPQNIIEGWRITLETAHKALQAHF